MSYQTFLIDVQKLYSNDINIVVSSLNELNKSVFESSANISTNQLGKLLIALCRLLEVIHPLVDGSKNAMPDELWSLEFVQYAESKNNEIFIDVQRENVVLTMILSIIRNISQETKNEYLIASSHVIIKHLSSIIAYTSFNVVDNSLSDSALMAFEIMNNVSNKIDFNAGSRFKSIFDTFTSSTEKEELVIHLSPYFSTISPSYIQACNNFIRILYLILMRRSNLRIVEIKCLEIITKLASVSENVSLFLTCPNTFLERLVQLLEMSYSSLPSLGNHFVEMIDSESRDLCIEIIHALSVGSTKFQLRFAQNSRLSKALYFIIKSSRLERAAYRNSEIIIKAIAVLQFLMVRKGSSLTGSHGDIIHDAFTDSDFLDLALTMNLNNESVLQQSSLSSRSSSNMNNKIMVENLKIE